MKHRLRDKSQNLQKQDLPQHDPYKLSIHTSSNFNKSDSGSKRLNISRMLENSRKKLSMRKTSDLFQSSIRPQSSKIAKRNQLIEFDNIKWISIISAYDPSRLKNVSVSKKSCQKFLSNQGQNIKSDSRNMLYFNDLIKNYKSWLNKIQMQYLYIMNKFLHERKSVNITLVELRPKLDEVINETVHMQENLEDCLKTYQNYEFRQLLKKYHAYLEKSRQIEDIIVVVNKSKNKIVNLYKKFDDDKKIQDKITKVKNQGIHEVRSIVAENNQVQLETKIMDRIQEAINEMASKSGQAYRKIRGIKELIERFKNTENQSQNMNKIDMQAINLMGKICKEICFEAEAFEAFSTRFSVDGGIINDDLHKIIKKYEQEVVFQRKKAIQLQMKFLNIIFSEMIKKLRDNSKISMVYQNADQNHEEYRQILRMIQDIADCILDQNKRVVLEKLIKQTRIIFDRLYEELKYLKSNKKFEEIDTEQGLISILQISKLIKQYKQKILIIRKKFESSHRDINLSPIKIQSIPNDLQIEFIDSVIALSKKINNSGLKEKLQQQKCFTPITNETTITQMSHQVQKQKILQEITSISNQFLLLQKKNILEKFFGPLKLQNLIFKETIVMIELKNLSSQTKQKNIIPQLKELLDKKNDWVGKHKKISPQMKRFFQRILANTLVKGLKQEDIKEIQNPQRNVFPTKQSQIQTLRSKAKYRQLLFDLIQSSSLQISKQPAIDSEIKVEENSKKHRVLKSAKTRYNSYVSDILERSITTINNFISSFVKISQIKKNINSESYLAKEYLIEFCQKLFVEVFLKSSKANGQLKKNQKMMNLLRELIVVCNDRILCLVRKVLQEENNWRQKQQSLQNESRLNQLPTHVQKVIDALQFYKSKTKHLSDTCRNVVEELEKTKENVENSQGEINEYLQLSSYAQIINSLVMYCKDTEQIVHVILDNSKSPIALINPNQNVIKQLFPGIKKGKQLSQAQIQKLVLNVANVGIKLKAKKTIVQGKQQNIKKVKKQLSMEEDILDQEVNSVKDDMDEQIADDGIDEIEDVDDDMPEDDMTEQFGEEIDQEPEEQMIEDFQEPNDEVNDDIEEEKIEEQKLDELIEESDHLGKSKSKNDKKNIKNDQFDQYDWQEDDDKTKTKIKNNKLQQSVKQKKMELQKKELETKQMQEKERKVRQNQEIEKENRMKKQHIVFSQTQLPNKIIHHTVYQILAFITSLYQLKRLISYVNQFQENYFRNSVDWPKVQQYYNNHNTNYPSSSKEIMQKNKQQVQKYMRTLEQNVESKLKKDYQAEPTVFSEIKNLETIKKLKKNLLLLKNGNWQALEKILSTNQVSYNIIKSPTASLSIWIKNPHTQFDEFGCIDGYLTKNFTYYQRNQFDIKGFSEKCFNADRIQQKQNSYISISYTVKSESSLITNPTETQNNYKKLQQTIQNFRVGAKDIVNKFYLCLQLYMKALQIKEKVQLDLDWYSEQIKFLQQNGANESNPLSYVKFVQENVKNVIKKIKSLQSRLYNLCFKCDKNNVFECIEELNELYGSQIEGKTILGKGQIKYTVFLFDKASITLNYDKIQKVLCSNPSTKEQKVEKIITSLFFFEQGQKFIQVTQGKILQNAQKLALKQSELLLQILTVVRVDHSYIMLNEKSLEYFVIKKSSSKCISAFLKRITTPILQSKQLTSIVKTHSFLSSFESLSNSSSDYQQVFTQESLDSLFSIKDNQTKFCKQTEVIVDKEVFALDRESWLTQSVNMIKEVVGCIGDQVKEVKKILGSLNKLKPCRYIYQKNFAKQKSAQIANLWTDHLNTFERIFLNTKSLLEKKNWLLKIKTISNQLKLITITSLSSNIKAIKSLMHQTNESSLQAISKQVQAAFEWITGIDNQNKLRFTIVTLLDSKKMVYFDFDLEKLTLEYFSENFEFLQPKNKELKEFLFKRLSNNLKLSNKQEEINKLYNLLTKNISIYQLDTKSLLSQLTKEFSQVISQQNQQRRKKKVHEIVRVFNKIYFITKTTKNLNFRQEIEALACLQSGFKNQLQNLQVIYCFKKMVEQYIVTFWAGNLEMLGLKQFFTVQFVKNEKIPQQEIGQILSRLSKIKINTNKISIDSYKPFYSWFYLTVMSIMKLPFYNIITHRRTGDKFSPQTTQFLGAVVTQTISKPGESNQQLQMLLKQILLFTEHKEIYLKQNDLTVELTRQPAFVQFQQMISGVELKVIVQYLNDNIQQQEGEEKKVLYLRVDQVIEKMNHQQQHSLARMIPLTQFVNNPQQQFNLTITQQHLASTVQFNIVQAPLLLKENQKYIPLNGSSVDSFENVYMGRHLRLEKIKAWLYTYYQGRKKQIEIENKSKQLEEFYNMFVQELLNKVDSDQKQLAQTILKTIRLQDILKHSSTSQSTQKLYLSSSLKLRQQCLKQLKLFKDKQYQKKPILLKHYDQSITQLMLNFNKKLLDQLLFTEGQIKIETQKRIQKKANDKVIVIGQRYLGQKEKQKQRQNSKEKQGYKCGEKQIVNGTNQVQSPSNDVQKQKIIQPIVKQVSKTRQQQELIILQSKDFSAYIQKLLQMHFPHLTPQLSRQLREQLYHKHQQKLSGSNNYKLKELTGKLSSKVYKIYSNKKCMHVDIEINAHLQIMFLLLVIEESTLDELELLISQ